MSSKSKKKKKIMLDGLDRSFRLKDVQPKTDAQMDTFDAWKEGYNLLLHGVAGTGKTYISMYLALCDIFEGHYDKVVIVRSVVPSRDMGFLPGTAKEKSAVFELPYAEVCCDLYQRGDAYNTLKTRGALEFMTTSFERGITINDSIIIVDEIQNMTFQELDTTVTRVGDNCKVILSGDIDQNDLIRSKYDVSGLPHFVDIIQNMQSFECIEFGVEDIVRSGFVKEYITQKYALESLE